MSEIATRLRVANVLEGSVRRVGNRVRVTVQLVDVKNAFHLWSERYESHGRNCLGGHRNALARLGITPNTKPPLPRVWKTG
jgi:TolB-like protein